MAINQAHNLIGLKEARQPYWADGILLVTNQNAVSMDAWNKGRALVTSCYKWSPELGVWRYGYGTRILALDALDEQAEMARDGQ
jgi:hypothetical protein